MRYYWLRDRKEQGQFNFIWDYGDQNDGDYFTKHHATIYHWEMRPHYIKDIVNKVTKNLEQICSQYTPEIMISQLRGCVDP